MRQVDAAFAAVSDNHAPRRTAISSPAQSLSAMSRLHVPPSRPLVIERPHLIERLNASRSGSSARCIGIERPHLIERLNAALAVTLTLISAPAGFGKTTLLTTWATHLQQNTFLTPAHDLASNPHQTAVVSEEIVHSSTSAITSIVWVSLDQADNDLLHFWHIVAHAFNTTRPNVGHRTQALLESPQLPPHTLLAHSLLADLNVLSERIVLILDDYHLITSKEVHESLITFIEHLPAHAHLVIATHADLCREGSSPH
ncbi:MAG: hypothetical protein ACUVSW_06145 [Roseiflexus sp.]